MESLMTRPMESARTDGSLVESPVMPLAGRGSRLVASIIDGIAAVVAILPGFLFLLYGSNEREETASVFGVCFMVVALVTLMGYQWTLLSRCGQTIGKRMAHVRVVRYQDDANPGFGRAVGLRLLVNGLFSGIPFVGGFYSLADILFIFGEERRCIHDYLAGTKVVVAV